MTQFLLPPGFRATDANDNPLSGGKYKFYSAQTTTPKAVYSDADFSTSLGTQVDINSAGIPVSGSNTPVLIYFATGDYKAELYDSDDVLLFTFDDIPGAEAAAPTVTSAAPETPVISKTSAYTVVVGDRAKLINANPTGGSFAITLPSAVTAGDDFRIGIRHAGTANTVSVLSVLSQNIKGQKHGTSLPLVSLGETVWLVSDGADWLVDTYVPPYMKGTIGSIEIQDRITSPPTSPTAGARYIITGTPTGIWNTLGFAEHDIAEADGNGSWIKYTPSDGWLAFIVTGGVRTEFKSGAWSDYTNITAPGTSALKVLSVADEKAQGTNGGTATSGSWIARVLNTERVNTITGASLSSNQITLPIGKFKVEASAAFFNSATSTLRFKSTTSSTVIYATSSLAANADAAGTTVVLTGYLDLSAPEIFELQYRVGATMASTGLGYPLNASGVAEVYSTVTIVDLASQQGPQGVAGAQGADGLDAAYPLQFSTSVSGDPGTGKIAGNNADLTLVTQLQISETDAYGASLAATIGTWDDSTSAVKATIAFHKEGASQNRGEYQITGAIVDQGNYREIPVTYVGSGGTLANADSLAVNVSRTGDKGDTGSTGSTGSAGPAGATGPNVGLDYAWNTATSGDPGSGKVLVNNATPASATALHISETNRQSASQAAYLATWDDGTTTSNKGIVRILDVAAPGTNFLEYRITGAITDAGAYDTFPVTYVGGAGTIANAAVIAVAFFPTGDKGADGAGTGDVTGQASSVDGEIALFSGIGGKTIKRASTTGLLKAASGVLSAAASGTDYAPATSGSAVLKGNGSGGTSTATAGTDYMKPDTTSNLTKGFDATSFSAGTKSSGTFTPAASDGNFQYATNNGAHTLAPPSTACSIMIEYVNGASAGAITTSGFTKVNGDSVTLTNGHKFLFFITKSQNYSLLSVQALQ